MLCPVCRSWNEDDSECTCGMVASQRVDSVHIRVIPGNKSKTCTAIEGLSQHMKSHMLNTHLKLWKAQWACGGHVTENDIIVLQGLHAPKVKGYLIVHDLVPANKIFVHGV